MRLKGQEIVKTRNVLNKTWEMEVMKLKRSPFEGYWQATYYDGADPACWGDPTTSREGAIRLCDKTVDRYFGPENKIVKIPT